MRRIPGSAPLFQASKSGAASDATRWYPCSVHRLEPAAAASGSAAAGRVLAGRAASSRRSRALRLWDFPIGINTVYEPRTDAPVSFAELRALADSHDITRLAIETRKDQLEKLDWTIKPRAMCRVDGEVRLRAFRLRNSGAGPTAHRRSRPGCARCWKTCWSSMRRLSNCGATEAVRSSVSTSSTEQRSSSCSMRPAAAKAAGAGFRTGHPGPAMEALDARRTALPAAQPAAAQGVRVRPGRADRHDGQHRAAAPGDAAAAFHRGQCAAGLLTAPDGWSVEQIRQFQEWFDSVLAGNAGARSRLVWAPSGTAYQAFTEAPYKDEFDEWLARIVCYAFSLPPTAFVRQVNRATAETAHWPLAEGWSR